MAQGKIWETILIYSRKVETWKLNAMFQRGWRTHSDEKVNEIRGRKGFAVNKDGSGSKTAEGWANAVPVLRKSARSRVAMLFDDLEEIVEERPNTPMKNLKVFNLEKRGRGGRAYKVVDEDGYVWDMREDVLLEAMITVGVSPGGTIGGEWVWGNVGSQGKLIRVGSQLHDDLTKETAKAKLKKISTKDLEVGGVYRSATGNVGVFVGFVHHAGSKKKQLWYEGGHDLESCRRGILQARFSRYHWKVKGSHTFVEKIGNMNLERAAHTDPCARIREEAINSLRSMHQSFTQDGQRGSYWARHYPDFKTYMNRYHRVKDPSDRITLYPYDTPVVPPEPTVQALLDQIS